jgi:hypothetical protein
MKRPGPPFGSGPDAEGKLRVAKHRSHTPADVGPASPTSLTASRSPTLLRVAAAPIWLEIILKPVDRRGRFRAEFDGTVIVPASTEPICAAARAQNKGPECQDSHRPIQRTYAATRRCRGGPERRVTPKRYQWLRLANRPKSAL